jgi:hypothetical protein
LHLPAGARPITLQIGGHPAPVPVGGFSTDTGVLELPVPRTNAGTGERPLQFEVVYDTDAPAVSFWNPRLVIDTPAPVLPVAALTVRRSWRLPPGLEPIPDGRQRRVPGAGEAASDALDHAISERFLVDTRLSAALAPIQPDTASQAEGLAAAAVGLRPKSGGRVVRLRELFADLTSQFLHGRLVIDDAALREAGLSPETQLGVLPPQGPTDQSPPWEALGLTAATVGPACLLTTETRARQWGSSGTPSDLIRTAVAEALMNGHDVSGHYRTTAEWIRRGTDAELDDTAEMMPDARPALTPWSEWEPRAGLNDDARITVVRKSHVRACGIFLAAAIVPGLWVFRRRDLFLMAYVGIAGLAFLWIPSSLQPLAWLPLFSGVIVALTGYLLLAARRSSLRLSQSGVAVRVTVAATACMLALAATIKHGFADDAAAAIVYIVPDTNGAPNKETVLVSPELADRLEKLARTQPGGGLPVITAISVEGKVAGQIANFVGVCEAYALGNSAAQLAIPLDGAYLEGDVLVDGARVWPESAAAPRAGFSVPLSGAGRHRVELHFRVPVASDGEQRSLHFTVPPATQSRLRLTLPAGASAVQVPTRNGWQRVSTEPNGLVLEAETGRVTEPMSVRWIKDAHAGKLEVREAYLWDLYPDRATLTGWLDYRVSDGSTAMAVVDLPAGLEVQTAEARRVGPGGAVHLRDWRISGAGASRKLEFQLDAPVSGSFQIGLTLVPSEPFPSETTLLLPGPHGRSSAQPSHLAYRAFGLDVGVVYARWLTGGAVDSFAPFWPESSRLDFRTNRDGVVAYAYTFRRPGGQIPVLRLHLSPAPPRLRLQRQEVAVHVSAHHAEVLGTLQVVTADSNPSVLSCRVVPADLTVSAVRGDRVRRWTQSGDRLTIWPESAAAGERRNEIALEISAWLPFDAGGIHLDVPSIQLDGSPPTPVTVRLIPEAGLALTPTGLKGLRVVPAAESELAFVADRPDYSGACEVRAGATGTAVRSLTLAGVRERRLTFRSTLEFSVPRGELRAAVVRLRNWDGDDVKLEVDKTVSLRQQRERRRPGNDRTWALEFRPGMTGRFRVTLSGSMPLEDAAAGVPMPDVSVPASSTAEAFVGVVGTDLASESGDGLSVTEGAVAALKKWPAEADEMRSNGGQLWKVAREDWTMRLRPRGGAGAEPVRILLADHSVAVADGRRWLHEVALWLRHGPNTDLNILLPKPGTVVAVSVDGLDVAPLQPERRRLWLPLPGRSGVRAVRIRWRYEDPAESLALPLLQMPLIEGASAGAAVWSVFVPAGFEAVSVKETTPQPGPGRAALVALYRAEAQLRVSDALTETTREGIATPLAAAQQRFYSLCGEADQALQLSGDDAVESGPNGESAGQWLRSLLDQNRRLAQDRGFEETRSDAERRADTQATPRRFPGQGELAALTGLAPERSMGPLPDAGKPFYLALSESTEPPALVIRPIEDGEWLRSLLASAIWLSALVGAAFVALLPSLKSRLLPFWPEPLLLIGVVLWFRFGLTPAAALFVLLGASGRLLTLADGIRGYFRSRRALRLAAAGATRGSGS